MSTRNVNADSVSLSRYCREWILIVRCFDASRRGELYGDNPLNVWYVVYLLYGGACIEQLVHLYAELVGTVNACEYLRIDL